MTLDAIRALYESPSDSEWSLLYSQAAIRTKSSQTALGNIVHSSAAQTAANPHYYRPEAAAKQKKQAAEPRFGPRELRDALRYYQAGSQARACGTGLGTPAVLASVPTSSGAPGGSAWAVVGGESTCSSPRCPKCRNSIMSRRGQEIQFCIDRWLESAPDAEVSMITFTAPHIWGDTLEDMLGSTKNRFGMRGAISLLKQRRLWKSNVQHFVSGLEITHGKNGWHCHFHVLIFHDSKLYKAKWHNAWRAACIQAGLKPPGEKHGVLIQKAENAANYIAKWSVASEAVGGNRKFAKQDNRAIFQIEQHAAMGRKDAIGVLVEYNEGTLRAKWHNFSRSLKKWRNELKGLRADIKPVLLFDAQSSAQLLQEDDLRALVVELAGSGISHVSDIGTALGLVAEIPAEPELLFVLEPYKRVKRQYDRALNESRWEDAAKLFALIEHYERSSYTAALSDAVSSSDKTISKKSDNTEVSMKSWLGAYH